MFEYLNASQREQVACFSSLLKNLSERSGEWELNEGVDQQSIDMLASEGILGGYVSREYGGSGWDALTYGMLNLLAGQFSPSLTGLFNVHFMVTKTIEKWGTESQKAKWLPRLTSGEIIGAFALTEPEVGSDIQSVNTTYTKTDEGIRLTGTKKWITFGAVADVFLVFGKQEGAGTVYLVEKGTPGFEIEPIKSMLGFRGAHLARLQFDNCLIREDHLVGKPGMALSFIAPYALRYGRLSVAFASLGILKGGMEVASAYANDRMTFGKKLVDQPIIQELLANMGMAYESAKFFCNQAAESIEHDLSKSMEAVMAAKYYASKMAATHIPEAIQVMGAAGCFEDNILPRLYRDAKIMEVVEGSNPVLVQFLGKHYAIKSRQEKLNDFDKKHSVSQYHLT
ncbi:acyl-CoA dehydrogenase family protein [Fulvivirga sp. 29W222]|uniref:Acyl-CoA dehydrogenase family protein n=1 Tax=Fulvivirga marina TaxID=2494733 RepID=A0A937G023_9BACT|nr:acyl-CoA dehydrogenase family protein [Fulvivirga marina]MBL6449320.1 acyl-CoA dehydrogenase family protein [Fulvivirga marina]